MPDGQRYQLTIRAEGELRDQDGNLISTDPVVMEREVGEDEAQAIAASLIKNEEIANDGRTLGSQPG